MILATATAVSGRVVHAMLLRRHPELEAVAVLCGCALRDGEKVAVVDTDHAFLTACATVVHFAIAEGVSMSRVRTGDREEAQKFVR
eukprot:866798-Prymnesium_polylepis.1